MSYLESAASLSKADDNEDEDEDEREESDEVEADREVEESVGGERWGRREGKQNEIEKKSES